MKYNLLFSAVFLTSMSLAGTQEDPFKVYKEKRLKNKVSERLFFIRRDNLFEIVSRFEKMNYLDACMDKALTADWVLHCSNVRSQLLELNNRYLPSEDEKLKRRLENPDELDILDFSLLFGPEESIAVGHMANVVGKNINRANIASQLDQKNDLLVKEVLDKLAYQYTFGSWGGWFFNHPEHAESFKNSLVTCLSLSRYECLEQREFVKNYIPKFDSQEKQKIAQLMVDRMEANSAHNQSKIHYQESLKNLSSQN